jgi:hypothetical protein
MSGLKDGSNMKTATGFAHASRTAPAGNFHGGQPPKGPAKEPWRLNGVPTPKERGVSKK